MSIKDGIRHDEKPADQQDLLRQLQELQRDFDVLQAAALRGADREDIREVRQQLLNEEAAAKLQARLWAEQQQASQDAGQIELNLTSFAQLDAKPIKYRIPGILLHEGLLLISGAAKIGKTTFILELIDCLRSGKPFLGIDCARIIDRIAYLNLEMPQSLLRYYATEMKLPLDSDHILVADLNGRAGKLGLLNETARRHLADQLRKAEVEALIFDPLSALVAAMPDANSNDNDLMRRVLEAVKALAAKADIDLVIVVDHTGHEAQGRARGASSKQDTPDMLWAIEKMGDDARRLTVSGRGVSGEHGYRLSQETQRLMPVEIADTSSKKSKKEEKEDDTLSRLRDVRQEHPDWTIRQVSDECKLGYGTVQRRWTKTSPAD